MKCVVSLMLCCLTTLGLLSACNGNKPNVLKMTEEIVIDYDQEAGELIRRAGCILQEGLQEKTGADVIVLGEAGQESGHTGADACRIVIGRTEGSPEQLKTGTFMIRVIEDELYILGSDEVDAYYGVQYFLEEILEGLTERVEVEDSGLCIQRDFGFVSEADETLPGVILNSTDSFAGVSNKIGEVENIGYCTSVQGGVATEEYVYVTRLDGESDATRAETYVLKYERSTMKEVACSEPMKLDHANDITYIPETNELYVVEHISSSLATVLDADTLAIKEEKQMKIACWGLEYNPLREQFVATRGIGKTIIYDRNLETICDALFSKQNTDLVTQGICADDRYIYHILWNFNTLEEYGGSEETANVIWVFDWAGNFITEIPTDIENLETENICLIGDTFIISGNGYDGVDAVYELKIEKLQITSE